MKLLLSLFVACVAAYMVHGQVQSLSHTDTVFMSKYQELFKLDPPTEGGSSVSLSEKSPLKYYLQSLQNTFFTAFYPHSISFEAYETLQKTNYRAAKKKPPKDSPYYLFTLGEIKLHQAVMDAVQGNYVAAFFQFKQSYNHHQDNLLRFPGFLPSKKTLGGCYILLSTVPKQFQWLVSMIGLKSGLNLGTDYLEEVIANDPAFSAEAALFRNHMLTLAFSKAHESLQSFEGLVKDFPENRLFLLTACWTAVRGNNSQWAIELLRSNPNWENHALSCYFGYLKGLAFQQTGQYEAAMPLFEKFLEGSQLEMFRKDTYYRLFMCQWFLDESEPPLHLLDSIKEHGNALTIVDKAALKFAKSPLPVKPMHEARMLFDGGSYGLAKAKLLSVRSGQLKTEKDQVEYEYRLARLYHQTGKLGLAVQQYEKVLEEGADLPHYFASMSALQLGYLQLEHLKDSVQARLYFQQVTSFPSHEYSESFEYKANAALEKFKKK